MSKPDEDTPPTPDEGIKGIFDELGVTTIEEDNIFTILKTLQNTKDIELKTSLTQNEIVVYNKALWFSDKYKVKSLSTFINKLMVLKISQDRKGREEMIRALSGWIEKLERLKGKEKLTEV